MQQPLSLRFLQYIYNKNNGLCLRISVTVQKDITYQADTHYFGADKLNFIGEAANKGLNQSDLIFFGGILGLSSGFFKKPLHMNDMGYWRTNLFTVCINNTDNKIM